jgi:hypothetical protein
MLPAAAPNNGGKGLAQGGFGQQVGLDLADTAGDAIRNRFRVAGEQDAAQPHICERRDGTWLQGARYRDGDRAEQPSSTATKISDAASTPTALINHRFTILEICFPLVQPGKQRRSRGFSLRTLLTAIAVVTKYSSHRRLARTRSRNRPQQLGA